LSFRLSASGFGPLPSDLRPERAASGCRWSSRSKVVGLSTDDALLQAVRNILKLNILLVVRRDCGPRAKGRCLKPKA